MEVVPSGMTGGLLFLYWWNGGLYLVGFGMGWAGAKLGRLWGEVRDMLYYLALHPSFHQHEEVRPYRRFFP